MSEYFEVLEICTKSIVVIDTSPSNQIKYVTVPLVPLTSDAFEPFGSVTQAYPIESAAPNGIRRTPANGRRTIELHKTELITSPYHQAIDTDSVETTGTSTFVYSPVTPSPVTEDSTIKVCVLERRQYTTQVFTPIMVDPRFTGYAASCERRYIVLVAKNGDDGLPALDTLKGFIATGAQGINYKPAVWYHPVLVLHEPMIFQCEKTQIGNGSIADCEVIIYKDDFIKLKLPEEIASPDVGQTEGVKGDLSDQIVPSVVFANR